MRILAPLVLLAAPAAAQNILFHESFENGLTGWTASGLWNHESALDPCGSTAAPFPGGTGAAYFGTAACNFVSGAGSGSLGWNAWVDLPAGATSITLRYWSRSHTEYCWGGWDIHEVHLAVEGGGDLLAPYCSPSASPANLAWHERRVDITSLAGSRVRPWFLFDSVDSVDNNTLGWLVDEISILVEPGSRICPAPGLDSGCPCAQAFVPVAGGCRNSTDQSAVLVSTGAPVVSADTLAFSARHLPPNASCLLVQAALSGTAVAFGDGVRCVSGQVRRMGALTASNGVASWPAAGTDPIALRGLVPPEGGTRYYYVYYRDVLPWCTSATFNLTDTQRIVWAP